MVARVMKKSRVHSCYGGHLDCLRFLFDKVKPSRDTEKEAAIQAAGCGHVDILKYFVEERKISEEVKSDCVATAAKYGHLDCLKYLVEEAKVPLDNWRYIAYARYHEHPECVNYLLEKGCSRTNGRRIRFVCRGRKTTLHNLDGEDGGISGILIATKRERERLRERLERKRSQKKGDTKNTSTHRINKQQHAYHTHRIPLVVLL